MSVEIKPAKTRKDLGHFIKLPAKIHKGHQNWVPPVYMDEWEYFDPSRNPSFAHCDHILLLACRNSEVVGRCMGLIHHKYNEDHNEKCVRFSFLETYNDAEVFNALIDHVALWGHGLGMDTLVGPLAFSDKDPQGLMIEGFDEPVPIATNCNYPFMVKLTENAGFSKLFDLVVYKIPIPDKFPPVYERVAERFRVNHKSISFVEFKSRWQLRMYIKPVLTLVNNTFTDVYGFSPFSEKEMIDFANRYIIFINPRFVKVALNEHKEVVGAVVAMSDISKGLKLSGGHLFPLGLIYILVSGILSRQLNLLLGAIDPRYQGRGIDVMMGIKLIESARKAGKTFMDSHLELEYNTKVRAEMELIGGVVYKKYRIYQKRISNVATII
ncbi:MAG: hypothetical protein JJU28_15985 [Cyclobacteriaceae bacterium]|nr:hypothetical protein [Cyclobacteriaceae bacterium]